MSARRVSGKGFSWLSASHHTLNPSVYALAFPAEASPTMRTRIPRSPDVSREGWTSGDRAP
jgi:hypothetical protein